MESTLASFFRAINSNHVDAALDCMSDEISVSYPDPGRNWTGKKKGRVVMTAVFGQLNRAAQVVTYEICKRNDAVIETMECWGGGVHRTSCKYTFDAQYKILKMES
mmetsp:Transcript_16866/g.25771  ORF Transcript_16866/g.25771 Transcript_16866/m.25771 type:complete len:106 (+) Transcript_16866:20-337(+)